jgi:hypothetical protein
MTEQSYNQLVKDSPELHLPALYKLYPWEAKRLSELTSEDIRAQRAAILLGRDNEMRTFDLPIMQGEPSDPDHLKIGDWE